MHFGVAAKGQAAMEPLANSCPKEDSTGTVRPGHPALWWEGVEPENTEGDKLDNDASWDASAQHARPDGADPFFDNSDDTFDVTNVFVVARCVHVYTVDQVLQVREFSVGVAGVNVETKTLI